MNWFGWTIAALADCALVYAGYRFVLLPTIDKRVALALAKRGL